VIVVEIKLASAISRARDMELGTMVIDNITDEATHCASDGKVGNYRCRMYRKGALKKAEGCARRMVSTAKHSREGKVLGHRRLAEPVQNLVAKALKEMGYG
jgi:hypothetical protein